MFQQTDDEWEELGAIELSVSACMHDANIWALLYQDEAELIELSLILLEHF